MSSSICRTFAHAGEWMSGVARPSDCRSSVRNRRECSASSVLADAIGSEARRGQLLVDPALERCRLRPAAMMSCSADAIGRSSAVLVLLLLRTGDYSGMSAPPARSPSGAAVRRGLNGWRNGARVTDPLRQNREHVRWSIARSSASSACEVRMTIGMSRVLARCAAHAAPAAVHARHHQVEQDDVGLLGSARSVRRRPSRASSMSKAGGGRHCRTRYRATSSSSIESTRSGRTVRACSDVSVSSSARRSTGFDR